MAYNAECRQDRHCLALAAVVDEIDEDYTCEEDCLGKGKALTQWLQKKPTRIKYEHIKRLLRDDFGESYNICRGHFSLLFGQLNYVALL